MPIGMNRISLALVVMAILVGQVSAVDTSTFEDAYNPNGLPGVVTSLLGDQQVVVHVTNTTPSWDTVDETSIETITIVTDEDAGIESITDTGSDNKTFEIAVDQDVLRSAGNDDDPQAYVVDAYRDGKVKYRGVGTWNAALTTTTKTATTTVSTVYNGVETVGGWLS